MKNLLLLSALFLVSFASAQIDLDNGLVARYKFNGDATDASLNQYDGTLHGNAIVNSTLSLGDATSDYLELPPEIMNNLGDFTVSLQIKFNALHTTGSFPTNHYLSGSSGSSLDRIGFSYEKNMNAWRAAINGQTNNFPDVNVTAGTIYCICIMRQGSTVKLYRNETLLGTFTASSSPLSISSLVVGQEEDCSGGCFAQNQCANARINNLIFWNRALNEDEMKTLCRMVSEKQMDEQTSHQLTIQPNPVTDVIDLLEKDISAIEIYDLNGHLIQKNLNSNKINVQTLSLGMYLLIATREDGSHEILKFVKK